jgi:hypothetical protein
MLRRFKFTLDCVVSIHDITNQDAENAYRNDPNVACYLAESEVLVKVVEQQRRLLQSILQHDEVLHRLMRRYIYEYIQERLYDDLPKPPEVNEELFLVMAEAIDALDFVDRALYMAYGSPQPEYEEDDDGDPFEQHTRLIRECFKIEPSRLELKEVTFGNE